MAILLTAIDVMECMCYSITLIRVNVIIYPYPELNCGLANLG